MFNKNFKKNILKNNILITQAHKKSCRSGELDQYILMYFDLLNSNSRPELPNQVSVFFLIKKTQTYVKKAPQNKESQIVLQPPHGRSCNLQFLQTNCSRYNKKINKFFISQLPLRTCYFEFLNSEFGFKLETSKTYQYQILRECSIFSIFIRHFGAPF